MTLLSYFKQFTIQISVAVTYFLAAQIALNFATVSGNMTLIWPASGIALTVLIRLGIQHAIGIFLGAFAAGVYVGDPHYVSGLIALGNTLEPLLALYLLRFLPFSANLYHIHDYHSIIFAGSIGAIISALLGGFAITFAGFIPYTQLPQTLVNWWMSDVIGILLIAPFLLMFSYIQITHSTLIKGLEFIALIVSSLFIAMFVLTELNTESIHEYKGGYLLYIPLFWAVLRFGQTITSLIIVEYFFIGIYGLTRQQGIFITEHLQPNLPLFWAYFVVMSIGSMVISYIIHERNTLYQAINTSHTETYVFCDEDMHFEFVNKAVLDSQRITAIEALKLTPFDLNPLLSKEEFSGYLKQLQEKEVPVIQFESFSHRNDGSFYPVEVNLQQIEGSSKQYYMASVTDISERMKKEAHRMLGNQVCELSPQAIMITDKDRNIFRVNTAFTTITGYEEKEVIGKNPRFLNSGRHDAKFYQQLWHSVNTKGRWSGDIYNRRKNGELYLQNITIKVLHNTLNEVENYISIFTDITKEHEQTLHLKHLAEHDVLTKLPNRVLLQEKFKFALAATKRHGKELGLLYLDLNDFKPINDNYGHTQGDIILQEVALRMESCIRETDMVARIGGDEFVILLSDITDKNTCQIISHKLKKSIEQPITIEMKNHHIKTSIGVAIYPEHGDSFDILLHHADMAMYKDKDKMKQIS